MAKVPRTRATLFVPGSPASLSSWLKVLGETGFEVAEGILRGNGLIFAVPYEWIENDGSFGNAFSLGTVSTRQREAIDDSPGALLLRLPVDLHRERVAIASFVAKLAEAGAMAVRLEESMLGYAIDRWTELVGSNNPWELYRATVAVLSSETGASNSCGMHAFSLPDAQIAGAMPPEEANHLLASLNVYQLTESPLLLTGHTFSPDARTPRRVLERWPDGTYPAEHPSHNPFGLWRLGPEGSVGAPPSRLALVFMPSLASLLLATEKKAGRPLEQHEVERVARNGVCISMKHAEASAFERERGYADIDPARAWEHWKIVRGCLG